MSHSVTVIEHPREQVRHSSKPHQTHLMVTDYCCLWDSWQFIFSSVLQTCTL